MKQKFTIFILLFLSKLVLAQIEKKIPIDKYFSIVDSLEFHKLKENGIIDGNNKIVKQYKEKNSETINEKGFEKLANIRAEVYMNYFKNYLLLQNLQYENDVYALYFSVAGFDDVEFQILKWKKENWKDFETIDKLTIDNPNQNFEKIAFNYDEGTKNLDNVRIFIQNDYLIMERSGLYHSLYDLRTSKLLINEESPWHSAKDHSEEGVNKWIKKNLHDKIKAKIKN